MSSDTRRVGAALYVVLTWILFWQMLHSLFPPFSPLPSVGGADIGGAVYAVAAGAPQHSAGGARRGGPVSGARRPRAGR